MPRTNKKKKKGKFLISSFLACNMLSMNGIARVYVYQHGVDVPV